MAWIYNVEMTIRQRDLVISIVQTLVNRLETQDDPTITYKDLAAQIGTSCRRLGQPLIRMAEVIRQCPVFPTVPSLNALVVYASTHLPNEAGLQNAQPHIDINHEGLMQIMHEMNAQAIAYRHWDDVIASIIANTHD